MSKLLLIIPKNKCKKPTIKDKETYSLIKKLKEWTIKCYSNKVAGKKDNGNKTILRTNSLSNKHEEIWIQ